MRLLVFAVVLAAACSDSDPFQPCDDPLTCPVEPLREVQFRLPMGGDGVYLDPALAQRGAVEVALFDADTVMPLAPPFTVDVDSDDFAVTLMPGSKVLLESVITGAGALTGTVRVRTSDGRVHGELAVTASEVTGVRLDSARNAVVDSVRPISLMPGAQVDVVAILAGAGGRLVDERATMSAEGAVSATPQRWDTIRLEPPATGAVTVIVTRATGAVPTAIPVSSGATSIVGRTGAWVGDERPEAVCAAALDVTARQLVGDIWTWALTAPDATISTHPLYDNCILLTPFINTGTITLTATVGSVTQTLTVEVRDTGS